jgi:proliferating cell nuclear antigen
VGGEIGNGTTTIKAKQAERDDERIELNVDEPVCLSFALRYLNLFNKAAYLSN